MTDVRTYTSTSALPSWATTITDAIRSGDLSKATILFRAAASRISLDNAIYIVAAAVEPGPNVIGVGAGPLVYGNPLRQGYAWRCGACLHDFRAGDRDGAAAGVNYKTLRGATNAAHKHRNEDHAGTVTVQEVTR